MNTTWKIGGNIGHVDSSPRGNLVPSNHSEGLLCDSEVGHRDRSTDSCSAPHGHSDSKASPSGIISYVPILQSVKTFSKSQASLRGDSSVPNEPRVKQLHESKASPSGASCVLGDPVDSSGSCLQGDDSAAAGHIGDSADESDSTQGPRTTR